jgi:hypothetical protein
MSLERSLELRGIYPKATGDTAIDGNLTTKTTVTTVTGLTVNYSGAQLVGGVIDHDPGAADAVTLDTGANIDEAIPQKLVGASFITHIKNAASGPNEDITLTLNPTGITVVPTQTTIVVRKGETLTLMFVRTAADAFTVHTLGVVKTLSPVQSGYVKYLNPIALSAVDVKANADIENIGATVPVDQPDYPRSILLTREWNAMDAGAAVTIIGVDVNGAARTSVYSLPLNDTNIEIDDAGLIVCWATVTSYAITGVAGISAGNDTLSMGYNNYLGLPCSPDGHLIAVHKAVQADDNVAIGTVNAVSCGIKQATATDGSVDYGFWYTYV